MIRRELIKGLGAGIFLPYVCRISGLLMPIADRSLVTYEVRGEKLAENGGPLPDPDWLKTMRFQVPRKRVNYEIRHELFAAAKQARPDVYWSGLIVEPSYAEGTM